MMLGLSPGNAPGSFLSEEHPFGPATALGGGSKGKGQGEAGDPEEVLRLEEQPNPGADVTCSSNGDVSITSPPFPRSVSSPGQPLSAPAGKRGPAASGSKPQRLTRSLEEDSREEPAGVPGAFPREESTSSEPGRGGSGGLGVVGASAQTSRAPQHSHGYSRSHSHSYSQNKQSRRTREGQPPRAPAPVTSPPAAAASDSVAAKTLSPLDAPAKESVAVKALPQVGRASSTRKPRAATPPAQGALSTGHKRHASVPSEPQAPGMPTAYPGRLLTDAQARQRLRQLSRAMRRPIPPALLVLAGRTSGILWADQQGSTLLGLPRGTGRGTHGSAGLTGGMDGASEGASGAPEVAELRRFFALGSERSWHLCGGEEATLHWQRAVERIGLRKSVAESLRLGPLRPGTPLAALDKYEHWLHLYPFKIEGVAEIELLGVVESKVSAHWAEDPLGWASAPSNEWAQGTLAPRPRSLEGGGSSHARGGQDAEVPRWHTLRHAARRAPEEGEDGRLGPVHSGLPLASGIGAPALTALQRQAARKTRSNSRSTDWSGEGAPEEGGTEQLQGQAPGAPGEAEGEIKRSSSADSRARRSGSRVLLAPSIPLGQLPIGQSHERVPSEEQEEAEEEPESVSAGKRGLAGLGHTLGELISPGSRGKDSKLLSAKGRGLTASSSWTLRRDGEWGGGERGGREERGGRRKRGEVPREGRGDESSAPPDSPETAPLFSMLSRNVTWNSTARNSLRPEVCPAAYASGEGLGYASNEDGASSNPMTPSSCSQVGSNRHQSFRKELESDSFRASDAGILGDNDRGSPSAAVCLPSPRSARHRRRPRGRSADSEDTAAPGAAFGAPTVGHEAPQPGGAHQVSALRAWTTESLLRVEAAARAESRAASKGLQGASRKGGGSGGSSIDWTTTGAPQAASSRSSTPSERRGNDSRMQAKGEEEKGGDKVRSAGSKSSVPAPGRSSRGPRRRVPLSETGLKPGVPEASVLGPLRTELAALTRSWTPNRRAFAPEAPTPLPLPGTKAPKALPRKTAVPGPGEGPAAAPAADSDRALGKGNIYRRSWTPTPPRSVFSLTGP